MGAGWTSDEFSYLLLLSSICSTAAVAALPTLEAGLGSPVRAAAGAMAGAAVAGLAAFAIAGGGASVS